MKIRFANLSINNLILNKFDDNKFHKRQNITNKIYSDEGIYYVVSDKIYKYNIHDEPCIKTTFTVNGKEYKIIIDKSSETKERCLSQIPFNHVCIQQELIKIKYQPHSIVSCILEKINGAVYDFYFETFEDVDNYSVIEDISSFLSEIYLC